VAIAKQLERLHEFETNDYVVQSGISTFSHPGKVMWLVINKSAYIELELLQLPAAIAAAYELQRALDKIRAGELEKEEVYPLMVPTQFPPGSDLN